MVIFVSNTWRWREVGSKNWTLAQHRASVWPMMFVVSPMYQIMLKNGK